MADGFDRYDREEHEGGGGSFRLGLLTGTVLGAGLGMLFAPKAGSDLRHQLGEQANSLGRAAGEQYRRAMRDRMPVTFENNYVWPDGREAWVEVRAYPAPDGLAIFYRDVSERKQAEERLREAEDHYRHTVELDHPDVRNDNRKNTLL